MKLNKPLIRKMIKDLIAFPESYDQGTPGQSYKSRIEEGRYQTEDSFSRPRPAPPCGSVECLMGVAIISNAPTRADGIKEMYRVLEEGDIKSVAIDLTGLPDKLFGATSTGWPEPYCTTWREAETYVDQTNAAVGMLHAILKTDGKILEQMIDQQDTEPRTYKCFCGAEFIIRFPENCDWNDYESGALEDAGWVLRGRDYFCPIHARDEL